MGKYEDQDWSHIWKLTRRDVWSYPWRQFSDCVEYTCWARSWTVVCQHNQSQMKECLSNHIKGQILENMQTSLRHKALINK